MGGRPFGRSSVRPLCRRAVVRRSTVRWSSPAHGWRTRMGDPTPVKLSLNQVAVLAILMAEARELSNTDPRELAGVTLTGTDRTGLSQLKLVEERKVGNTYYFELSPAGWSTAAGLLAEQSRAKGLTKGAATGALLALLGGVARGLAGQGHDPRAFFRGTPDPRPDSAPAASPPVEPPVGQTAAPV